jgi:uncharacterized protein (TIGR02147 family)
MSNSAKISIFQYLDYRAYLRDLYAHLKLTKPQFSFRFFSKQAGFSSPNYLKMVMDGDRNLTQASTLKFIQGLKLGKDEAEFFENLVHYTQADSLQDKNFYYERLASSKAYLTLHQLEKASFEYFSKWYNVAIREMLSLKNFRPDPAWIACHLQPHIDIAEAQKALNTLLKLGLVEKKEKKLLKANGNLATEREVHSIAVSNIHKELITKGMESIDRIASKKRDISGLTVAIREEQIPALKEMVQNFMQQIHVLHLMTR